MTNLLTSYFRRFCLSWLTIRAVWWAFLPAGMLTILNLKSVHPNDFWWHLRTGQIIAQEGAIPTVDLFTYTRAGQPWINQAWLMQLAFYLIYQVGALPAIIIFHGLLVTAGYMLVVLRLARQYQIRIAVLAVLVGIVPGLQNWAIRPQGISYLCFGALLFLLEGYRSRGSPGYLWGIPFIFAFWGNAHGGFVFGLALLGLFIAGQLWDAFSTSRTEFPARARHLLLAGAGAALALTLNPQGLFGLVNYVMGFLHSKATLDYNLEFSPLTLRSTGGVLFYGATAIFMFAVLRAKVQLATDQLLNLLFFAALTLFSLRASPWYGLVLMPVLAMALQANIGGWLARSSEDKPWLNLTFLIVLASFVLTTFPGWREQIPMLAAKRPLLSADTPIAATEYLCSTLPPGTPGYQYYVFASYQVAACPSLPIFIDTRFELYPLEQWQDYLAISRGQYNWEKILAKYGAFYLFLSLEDQPILVEAVSQDPDWETIYQDEQAIILHRRNTSSLQPD